MISETDRKAMKTRLARIEGQVRGIQRMIDEQDADCEQVAQQMTAARRALDKAAHSMLACMVREQVRAGDQEAIDGLETIIGKYA